MPTATKTPSAEFRRLDAARDESYVALQEVKRQHQAYDDETEAMRAKVTAHTHTHPEQYEGAARYPKPNTEAAELRDETRKRMREPNPHQPERDAAVSEFHGHDIALTEWKTRNVQARIAEFEPDARAAVEQIRRGFEQVLRGVELYNVCTEQVRGIVISTERLTGQDVREDPRVSEWAQLAAAVPDGEVTLPGLNDRAAALVAEHE